ncbi:stage III sporulation protein AG [Clostridium sp. YIM B02515]|uniref:Stage III sporulation protein AG n=1 Tax=Clostridium rhizosphaerae TaxID=2803861 RepID=A0ABS1TH19_9CLOT|nr:stage III sporulation protein AG [Clostridium rhizosphaerae]MBL4937911.1 stage III sporulation protein AG [Clostridium rhizosphaerae]
MDINKILDEIVNRIKKLFTSEEDKIEKKKNNKLPNFLIICLSLVLISVLVILGNDFFKSTSAVKINSQANSPQPREGFSVSDYETTEENKLKAVLEDIDGVGRVKVMLTIDGSEEQVPAVNINNSTSNTKEQDNNGGTRETTQKNDGSTIVLTNEGDKNQPLIVKTNKPKIVGVCVVAEGAKERVVELKITQAVTRLYNIRPDKVSVYPMKK